MDERILKFILKMNILTMAMSDENNEIYIANAFYVFDEHNLSFIISSSKDSKHIKLAKLNKNIAISVYKNSKIKFLQGIQVKAIFKDALNFQKNMYYEKYPFAKFYKESEVFSLSIKWLKFTDNKLLLDKKLEFKI